MQITVITPTLYTKGFWSFKEPFHAFVSNNFNVDLVNTKQTMISIMSMKDLIANNYIDPFTAIYNPAGLSEVDYKEDLLDDVPILSFSGFSGTTEILFRVPLNYVYAVPSDSDVTYRNKAIVIDLGLLPEKVDLSIHNADVKNFAMSKYGVDAAVKEVEVGPPTYVSSSVSKVNETIRINSATVRETNLLQLKKISGLYNEMNYKFERVSDCFIKAVSRIKTLEGTFAASGYVVYASTPTVIKGSSFWTRIVGNFPDGTAVNWVSNKIVAGASTPPVTLKPTLGVAYFENNEVIIYHYVNSSAVDNDIRININIKYNLTDANFVYIGPDVTTPVPKYSPNSFAFTHVSANLPIGNDISAMASDDSYRTLANIFYA